MSYSTLESIEHVLHDYDVSADAMRWTPNPEDANESPDATRRKHMWARWGIPTQVKAGPALWVLGLDAEVHPSDVAAFAYINREAAQAYEDANLWHHGHPTLGSFEDRRGVVSVLDLRPALREMDRKIQQPQPVHRHGSAYRRRRRTR